MNVHLYTTLCIQIIVFLWFFINSITAQLASWVKHASKLDKINVKKHGLPQNSFPDVFIIV